MMNKGEMLKMSNSERMLNIEELLAGNSDYEISDEVSNSGKSTSIYDDVQRKEE